MKKNIWLLIILIAVIFLSGAASGFFAGRLTAEKGPRRYRKFQRSKEKMKERFIKHICKKLKLTDSQIEPATKIIDEWLEKMDKLRQKHAPEYEQVFNEFYKNILPVLGEEQKLELEKLKSRFLKNKQDDKDNPPPPPPM
jgi:peptidoglycan hydrolase CwlO-like protein